MATMDPQMRLKVTFIRTLPGLL